MLVYCSSYSRNQVGPIDKWHLAKLILVAGKWGTFSFEVITNNGLRQGTVFALTCDRHIE